MSASNDYDPRISIAQVGATVAGTGGDGTYAMTFVVGNAGGEAASLIEARMPHVVLRAEALDLTSRRALEPDKTAELAFHVTYRPRKDASDPSNPFLILRLVLVGEEWRVLAQLALAYDEGGVPTTTTAVVSAHRVGFSASV
jgi:hypothetical protein